VSQWNQAGEARTATPHLKCKGVSPAAGQTRNPSRGVRVRLDAPDVCSAWAQSLGCKALSFSATHPWL